MNLNDNNKEKEGLMKLVKTYTAQDAVDIYNKFVHQYKHKHLGEIMHSLDITQTNEWYKRRGDVFERYINLYHSKK